MIKRILEKHLINELEKPEIIIINGARRVGKTVLVQTLRKNIKGKNTAYFDFTDPSSIQIWSGYSIARIQSILTDLKMEKQGVIFFDEIQYFDNIGLLLKLFYDHFKKIKIIATGSSSFLFLQNIGDSLAGRKKIFTLYPLSLEESTGLSGINYWSFKEKILDKDSLTEGVKKILIYGSYPEIYLLKNPEEKKEKLKELIDSYLFNDLFKLEGVKNPRIIIELTKLLAYQIGSLVNPNELASTLGISRKTVLHYIDLLERFFIIYRIYPYEKNERDLIKKKFKAYFYDPGIRNALIGNFSSLQIREDKGFLLENAVVLGLKRRVDYDRKFYSIYFWRDYDAREIDIILKNSQEWAYEIKWMKKNYKFFKNSFKNNKIIEFLDSYKYLL